MLPPLLEERGWTQKRLADETGMRRTDMNAIVRGRLSVGPTRLARIAAALKVSEEQLAGWPAATSSEVSRDRLEELAETVAELVVNQAQVLRELASCRTRLERIEARLGEDGDASRDRQRHAR